MIRLFVGLALPEALAAQLAILGGGIPGARWVPARNLHLTLRFVGEVDEVVAEELHHQLAGVSTAPLSLTIAGFGTFGGRKPRALWAGIEASPALLALQAKTEWAAQAVGLTPEGRKYSPHVTLARLHNAAPDRLAAFMRHHGGFKQTFTVDDFVLFRSHLGGEGAEYEALAHYPLVSK